MKKRRPIYQLYVNVNFYSNKIVNVKWSKPVNLFLSSFLITAKGINIDDKRYRLLFPAESEYKYHFYDSSSHNKSVKVPNPNKWIVVNAYICEEKSGRIDVYIRPRRGMKR